MTVPLAVPGKQSRKPMKARVLDDRGNTALTVFNVPTRSTPLTSDHVYSA